MKNDHLRKYFILYLDEELSAPLRTRMDDHLRTCPSCRADLDRLQQVCRPAAGIARQTVPPFAWTRLQARLRDEPPRSWRLLPRPQPLALTTALLLALLCGIYLGNVPMATEALPADQSLEQALSLDIFSANPPLSLGQAVMTVYGQSGEGVQ